MQLSAEECISTYTIATSDDCKGSSLNRLQMIVSEVRSIVAAPDNDAAAAIVARWGCTGLRAGWERRFSRIIRGHAFRILRFKREDAEAGVVGCVA